LHNKLLEPIKKDTFGDLGNVVYGRYLADADLSSPGFISTGVTDADSKAAGN